MLNGSIHCPDCLDGNPGSKLSTLCAPRVRQLTGESRTFAKSHAGDRMESSLDTYLSLNAKSNRTSPVLPLE